MTVAASMNTAQTHPPITAERGKKARSHRDNAAKTLSTPLTVETDFDSLFKGITDDLGKLDIIYPCY